MATKPQSQAPQGDQKQQETAKQTYAVISPLEHNGELIAAGGEVELTKDEASPLLGHTVSARPASK